MNAAPLSIRRADLNYSVSQPLPFLYYEQWHCCADLSVGPSTMFIYCSIPNDALMCLLGILQQSRLKLVAFLESSRMHLTLTLSLHFSCASFEVALKTPMLASFPRIQAARLSCASFRWSTSFVAIRWQVLFLPPGSS